MCFNNLLQLKDKL
jgi:ABC-type transporter Mla subunit MlaD